jgi:hypothetical protein
MHVTDGAGLLRKTHCIYPMQCNGIRKTLICSVLTLITYLIYKQDSHNAKSDFCYCCDTVR